MANDYGFELTGTMPLLMHADNIDWSDELSAFRKAAKQLKTSVAGDDRSPPWTWYGYCYWDGEGNLVMPSENIMVALRGAAAQVIMKGQKSFKALSQSGLLITDEFCRFEFGKGYTLNQGLLPDRQSDFATQLSWSEKSGFRLFSKRAKVGTSKHIRVRPRFDEWKVSGRITILTPEISKQNLIDFFDLAGQQGLCDWRPSGKTPGPFGQFTAKIVK